MTSSIFSCAYLSSKYLFWWSICSDLLPLYGVFFPPNIEFWELFILTTGPLVDICFTNMILQSMGSFRNIKYYFEDWNFTVFFFSSSVYQFVLIWTVALVLYWRNLCLIQGHYDFLLLSSRSFIVLGFQLRWIVHFKLLFVYSVRYGQSSFFPLP